jgi:phage tail protein X
MSFDASTGLLSGAAPATAGSWTVTITATDSDGASASCTFTVSSAAGSSVATSTGSGTVLSAVGTSQAAAATPNSDTVITSDYWFTYDKENRTKISNGHLLDGQIGLAGGPTPVGYGPHYQGGLTMYDAVGNAIGAIDCEAWDQPYTFTRSFFTERGQLSVVMAPVYLHTSEMLQGTALAWTAPIERRFYDNAGRLTEVQSFFNKWAVATNTSGTGPTSVDVVGWMEHATTYTYNNDNQVTSQSEYGRIGQYWINPIMTASGGNVSTVLVAQSSNRSSLGLLSTTTITRNSADVVGTLKYQQFNAAGAPQSGIPTAFTHTYTYTTLKGEGYLENTITGSSTDNNFKAATTTSTYDAYGQRKTVRETAKTTLVDDTLRYFSYDGAGMILTRWDGKWKNSAFNQGDTTVQQKSNRHHFVYSNRAQVGQVDDLGRLDVVSQLTAFKSGENGNNTVTVQAGDTLESLAQRVYGTSTLWYVLASANGLTDNSSLVVSMTLKVPDVKVSKNDAGTIKPYDPAAIVGDTIPSLPYISPPKAAGCSTFATIIRIVVAIAVMAMMPEAAPTMSQLFAIGGVAAGGEAFAQTIEISEGLREGYDVGGIAASAVMAVLPGTGAAGKLQKLAAKGMWGKAAAAAIQSVGSSLMATAVNGALGRDTHFSWKNVAVGAVTAAISSGLDFGSRTTPGAPATPGLTAPPPPPAFKWGDALEVGLKAVGREALQYGVAKAIIGEAHWSWGSVAASVASDVALGWAGSDIANQRWEAKYEPADEFGNALGNAMARRFQNGSVSRGPQADQAEVPTSGNSYADDQFSVLGWALNNGNTGFSTESVMGGVTMLPQSSTASGTFAPSSALSAQDRKLIGTASPWGGTWQEFGGELVQDIPKLVVKGSGAAAKNYFNAWYYSRQYGAPGPTPDLSDQQVRQLQRQQAAWRESLPVTQNYNRWLSDSWEGRANKTDSGPRRYFTAAEIAEHRAKDARDFVTFLAFTGPLPGLAGAAATLSPIAAGALTAYGAYSGGKDIVEGHYVRGGLTLGLSALGGGVVASELRAAGSVRGMFFSPLGTTRGVAQLEAAGRLQSFNGMRGLEAEAAIAEANSASLVADNVAGEFTRIKFQDDRVYALVPSKAGTGPLRWARTDRLNPTASTHGNRLSNPNPTHVYSIFELLGDGSRAYWKIGESSMGVRVADGASIRAEQQARALMNEYPDKYFRSEIREWLPNKADARMYETSLIERYRSVFGSDTLPGNLTNR